MVGDVAVVIIDGGVVVTDGAVVVDTNYITTVLPVLG